MDPAIYIETDVPPGLTLDEWRTRIVRPSTAKSPGRSRTKTRRISLRVQPKQR
jgi:hypothetical protein